MAKHRLVPEATQRHWELRLSAAFSRAYQHQRRAVASRLRVRGISLTAAGNGPGIVWNDDSWRDVVMAEVMPEAQAIATEAEGTVAVRLAPEATWGMPSSADAYANTVAQAAVDAGGTIGSRIDDRTQVLQALEAAHARDEAAGDAYRSEIAAQKAEKAIRAAESNIADALDSGAAQFDMMSESFTNAIVNGVSQDATSYMAGLTGNVNYSATVTWNAVGDERTREAHLDADGQEVGLNESFIVDDEELLYPGDPNGSDGNTINCRCVAPGTLVSGLVEAGAVRWYDGEMVRLSTSFGHELATTPEHPILTRRGWVAAGFLEPGDQVLRDRGAERVRGSGPHVRDIPTRVEQVVRAIQEISVAAGEGVGRLSVDLNRPSVNGEVDVVAAPRHLALYVDSAAAEQIHQEHLSVAQAEMSSARPGGSVVGVCHAEHVGGASSSRFDASLEQATPDGRAVDAQSERQRLLGLTRPVAAYEILVVDRDPLWHDGDPASFVAGADRHAGLAERLDHGAVVDAGLLGELNGRFPRAVATDEVVGVEHFPFRGHVYDLQTPTRCFMAGGILVHNCWLTYDGVTEDGGDASADGDAEAQQEDQ